MTSLQDRRKALEARLEELEDRLKQIDAELEGQGTKDWEDLAQEREHDEVLEDMGSNSSAEIRMIRAALARMDEGEYGFCARCGDEISAERLDILPYTPFCAHCAAEVEVAGGS